MRRRFLRWVAWKRSGSFLPAVSPIVVVTAAILAMVAVGASFLRNPPGLSPAGRSAYLTFATGAIIGIVAGVLPTFMQATLTSFTILQRGIERYGDRRLTVLIRVEKLRAGHALTEDEKAETVAMITSEGWATSEQARSLVNGRGTDQLLEYFEHGLAGGPSGRRWAAQRLLAERPPRAGSSPGSSPSPSPNSARGRLRARGPA